MIHGWRLQGAGWRRATMLAGCLVFTASHVCATALAQEVATTSDSKGHKAIQPADIVGLTDVDDVEISPDGSSILYVKQRKTPKNSAGVSEIWVAATDGSSAARKLTSDAAMERSPRWSPDGERIAFLSDRSVPSAAPQSFPEEKDQKTPRKANAQDSSAGSHQIWMVSVNGGEAQQLTSIGRGVGRFRWSPDGRSIAFLARDVFTEAEKADRVAKRDWVNVDTPRDLARLWFLDVHSRSTRRVSIEGRNITDMNWSPDGKRLAVRAAATSGLNDHFYYSELLVLNSKSGKVEKKLFDRVYSTGSWSPDSRRVAFTAPEEGTIGIRAFVADVASGAVQQLGATFDGTIRKLVWSRENDTVLARIVVHTRDTLFAVELPRGRFRPVITFDGQIKDFSVASEGSIAVTGNQPDRASDIWIFRSDELQRVTDLNPQMREWNIGSVEELSWTSTRDGRVIYGVLVTPPDFSKGKPRKTVVLAHGGPHDSWRTAWQGSWIDWAQMLASHGYVVLLPNPRGSAGQGTEFARGVVGGWGSLDYQDIADGVDLLVARKIADPSRLGIGGWSYGGFMSAWAVSHDNRFKAAVVGAALTHTFTMALSTDTPDFVTAYFELTPSGISKMDASSPMRAVDRVKTPVLVLHGAEDKRVPLSQGLGFYRGLKLLGKDAEMVIYPREPHRISEFEHQLDIQRRVLAWYDAHI